MTTRTIVGASVVLAALFSGSALAGECSARKAEWIFCEDFEGTPFLSQWQEVSHRDRKVLETNTANVREGSKSLKLVFVPGSTDGAGWMHHWWQPAANQGELYMRWYVKHSTGFNFGGWDVKMAGLTAHLPGVKYGPGAGTIPDGTWYASRLLSLGVNNASSGAGAKQPLFYYYYPDQKSGWGDFGAQNRAPAVTLLDNKWYCMEMRIKPNTVVANANGTYTGLHDGEQTLWIDGAEKAHYTSIRWRTNPNVHMNDLFHSAWVGQPRASAEQFRWEDNYVVSTKRVGCLGSVLPSAPTALQVR